MIDSPTSLKDTSPNKPTMPGWLDWLALLICAAGSFALVLLATRWGAGLSIDSLRYLKAGAHLDVALGLSDSPGMRLTHYPPLFPMVLSLGRFFSIDPWTTARWLNASLMALSTILTGTIFLKLGGARSWAGLWGVALFAVAPDLMLVHAMVWSEPLYIALMLVTVLAFLIYLTGGHRSPPLLLAGVAVALACLTRYAGGAMILAGCLTILLLHGHRITKRLLQASLFGAIASLPLLFWIIYNKMTAGTATNRNIELHLASSEIFRQLGRTVGHWWLPENIPNMLRIVLIVLFITTGITVLPLLRKPIGADQRLGVSIQLIKLMAIFSVVYVLLIMVSISFFDPSTPMDSRILSPLFVTGLLFNVIALKCLLRRGQPSRLRTVSLVLLCAALLVAYGLSTSAFARESSREGLMWGKRKFTDPALHSALDEVGRSKIIYSNAPRPLAANLGRRVTPLPQRLFAGRAGGSAQYQTEMRRLKDQVENGQAQVVFFDDEENRQKFIGED